MRYVWLALALTVAPFVWVHDNKALVHDGKLLVTISTPFVPSTCDSMLPYTITQPYSTYPTTTNPWTVYAGLGTATNPTLIDGGWDDGPSNNDAGCWSNAGNTVITCPTDPTLAVSALWQFPKALSPPYYEIIYQSQNATYQVNGDGGSHRFTIWARPMPDGGTYGGQAACLDGLGGGVEHYTTAALRPNVWVYYELDLVNDPGGYFEFGYNYPTCSTNAVGELIMIAGANIHHDDGGHALVNTQLSQLDTCTRGP